MNASRHRPRGAGGHILESAGLSAGRWPASALVEHDTPGRPLPRPSPKRRHTVLWVLRSVGVLAAAAAGLLTDVAAVTAAFLLALVVFPALRGGLPSRHLLGEAPQPSGWKRR